MRILLDTHAMLWWLRADSRLSKRARNVINDGRNELLWSVASSWEIAVKVSIGKLELDKPIHRLFAEIIGGQGAKLLSVSHEHCSLLADLPLHHRDPFDRMLVVQARVEKAPILTADSKFSAYDVEILW